MKTFSCKGFAALLVALVLVVGLTTPVGQAAQSCVVTYSDPVVTVGQTFTVKVNLRGAVGIATIKLNFDSAYLQYISGDLGFGGVSGTSITLDKENAGAGNMSFSLTFKALKTGKTTIDCFKYDIQDGNGDPMSVNMGNSTVTIQAPPAASGDANLSALSISPGRLSPGFSAGTTSYRATVPNGTTSIAVRANTSHGKARIAVRGNTKLKVGDNTVTVQVTAENGAQKVYTIIVNRAAGGEGGEGDAPTTSPEPSPDNGAVVTLPDGAQLPVSQTLPDGANIPGFEVGELEYQGKKLPCLAVKDGNYKAVHLAGDETHPAGFYFLDVSTGAITPVVQTAMAKGQLILLNIPDSMTPPEGYTSILTKLGDVQHSVWVPQEDDEPNHYIVYALDNAGTAELYLYDVEQETYQRYQFTQRVAETKTDEPQQENGFVFSLFGWQVETRWSNQVVSYILVGLASVAVILLIVVIVLAVCLGKSRKALRRARLIQEERRQRDIVEGVVTPIQENRNYSATGDSDTPTVDDILAEYRQDDTEDRQI